MRSSNVTRLSADKYNARQIVPAIAISRFRFQRLPSHAATIPRDAVPVVAQRKESHRRHPVERTRATSAAAALSSAQPAQGFLTISLLYARTPGAPRRTRSRFLPGHRVSFTEGPILVKRQN